MTTEESNLFINTVLKIFKKKIDIAFSFCIDGKIKNIVYDSKTKQLSEPFPDKTDDNKVLVQPFLDGKGFYMRYKI